MARSAPGLASLALCVLAACAATDARAVMITSGTGNTTAAGDFATPFAHVGARGVGTGVYLGNGYVLTANHVGAGSINLGGKTYNAIPASGVRLHAPGDPGTLVDLLVYQIDLDSNDPDSTPDLTLGTLPLGDIRPNVGETLRMVGNGWDRDPGQTHWQVDSGGTWTETTDPPFHFTGYKATNTRTTRWGENSLEGHGEPIGNTVTFFTDFSTTGLPHEAQAVGHDSGGGVFHFDPVDNRYELVGIMLAVSLHPGQPNLPGDVTTAVFGNRTYIADLSLYADQINALVFVPEPTAVALLALGAPLALLRRR